MKSYKKISTTSKTNYKKHPPKTKEDEDVNYKEKYLRALADYQNLLKRTQIEKQEFITYAQESFIKKLLPVLDHVERAEKNTKDEGIQLVYKELWKFVNSLGVERINIQKNESFNPEYMECIEAEEGGAILQELQTGYRYKGKVIRPVKVKVVKGKN